MDLLIEVREARDNLLARVQHVLESDTRINAAWLSGSYGRGEADAWSDLDLHVVVADDHLEAVLAEHDALFARCGQHIATFGGMRSWSMPGGYFWLVQYVPYMLEIDWNIGPTSGTTQPSASLMLFDRVGIPVTPMQSAPDVDALRKEAEHQLTLFWAMAPLAMKFAGRGHTRRAVHQVELLEDALMQVWRVLYNPSRLQKDAHHQNRPLEAELDALLPRFGPVIDPVAALQVIQAYCVEMAKLHPALAQMGVRVHEEVVPQVAAFHELVEPNAVAGGSTPARGSRR